MAFAQAGWTFKSPSLSNSMIRGRASWIMLWNMAKMALIPVNMCGKHHHLRCSANLSIASALAVWMLESLSLNHLTIWGIDPLISSWSAARKLSSLLEEWGRYDRLRCSMSLLITFIPAIRTSQSLSWNDFIICGITLLIVSWNVAKSASIL
jgi:hypothetical protein